MEQDMNNYNTIINHYRRIYDTNQINDTNRIHQTKHITEDRREASIT